MKVFKIYILSIVVLLAASEARAQFKTAEIAVSGLTCSMCSYATEKALRTLDFVEDVKPDLNKNTFLIIFKTGKPVSVDKIQAKVKGAGFSVFQLVAVFSFKNVKVKEGYHFTYNGDVYDFMKIKDKTLNGDVKITFLDKGFVADDVYKKTAKAAAQKCYESGHTEACCPSAPAKQRVYHVTL